MKEDLPLISISSNIFAAHYYIKLQCCLGARTSIQETNETPNFFNHFDPSKNIGTKCKTQK